MKEIKTISPKEATIKVLKLRENTKIDDLAVMLGLAKKTVYKRMNGMGWTLAERVLIERL